MDNAMLVQINQGLRYRQRKAKRLGRNVQGLRAVLLDLPPDIAFQGLPLNSTLAILLCHAEAHFLMGRQLRIVAEAATRIRRCQGCAATSLNSPRHLFAQLPHRTERREMAKVEY